MGEITIIVISLLFSAYFSGMEIAYISSNRILLEIEKKQENFLARILTKLTAKPSKFIATMLVGNNIALVVYGFFMGGLLLGWFQSFLPLTGLWAFLEPLLTNFSLLTQTLISTFVILLAAEFIPKVFFQIYSSRLLIILAPFTYVFYQLLSPITYVVIGLSDAVLKYFFKTDGDEVQLAFTKVELGDYINEQMESIDNRDDVDSEIQIFQNALEFSEVKAREVMIPRTEIVAVESHTSPKDLSALFTKTGYSKILIFRNTVDDIVGYVHSFELFKRPRTIQSILRPIEFVPETVPIQRVLDVLTKKRKSIAVVVDEYGGTSGMVTVEDIVEELFGEIEDEHDSIELLEERLEESKFRFSARLEVDYLNEEYGLEIPESDTYETLGGFIVSYTEDIPEQDDVVLAGNYRFTVMEVSNTKIDTLLLEVLEQD